MLAWLSVWGEMQICMVVVVMVVVVVCYLISDFDYLNQLIGSPDEYFFQQLY